MVKWKKLADIANILYGYPFESSLFTEDNSYIPLIRIRDVKPAKASTYYSGDIIDNYIIKRGDILVGMDGEFNLGKWNDRNGLLNQRVLKMSGKCHICENGYLYHYMGPVFKKIEKETPGGSVKHLSAKVINKITIPIPSLSEQNRIVGILDTFTSSIENLKEQIALRRKQYEHYRDQLLDLEGKEGVEMKLCGNVCYISDYVSNGSFASLRENVKYKTEPDYAVLVRYADYSNHFDESKFVFIDEHAYNFLSKSSLEGGEIIMSNVGSCGLSFRCPKLEYKMSLAPNSILIKSDYVDYLFYWFNTRFGQEAIKKITSKSAMPKFNKTEFKKIEIPIPSIQEQKRIVSILDTFEASIQNLEAQLKEREKQYEYYRNKLLTFE